MAHGLQSVSRNPEVIEFGRTPSCHPSVSPHCAVHIEILARQSPTFLLRPEGERERKLGNSMEQELQIKLQTCHWSYRKAQLWAYEFESYS